QATSLGSGANEDRSLTPHDMSQLNGIQFLHFFRFFRLDLGPLLGAAALGGEEVFAAGRQLPLLRRVESTLCRPSVGLDGDRLARRQATPPRGTRRNSTGLAPRIALLEPGSARVLQVRRVPAGEPED